MTAALVIAHFNEDLKWMHDVDVDKYKVFLVSKTLQTASIYQSENIGYEASAYMEYIIANYDDLLPYSVFVHGHEHSYHHVGSMPALVNALRLDRPYHNFNGSQSDDQFYVTLVDSGKVIGSHSDSHEFWERYHHRFFANIGGLWIPGPDSTFRYRMSAQFAVHRDLIRRHTRDQWRGMLAALTEACYQEPRDMMSMAKAFEYSWFTLFTGETDEKLWNDAALIS